MEHEAYQNRLGLMFLAPLLMTLLESIVVRGSALYIYFCHPIAASKNVIQNYFIDSYIYIYFFQVISTTEPVAGKSSDDFPRNIVNGLYILRAACMHI